MADTSNLFSRRYALALRRVRESGTPAYSPEMVVADAVPRHVRRFTEFSGDVSGRYIGALACASLDRGESYQELASIVQEVIRQQKPQGYFGGAFAANGIRKEDMAVLWGNGRLLIGLVEYHRLSKDSSCLASARRLGDFLVQISDQMNSDAVRKQFEDGAFAMGYICWTQIIEGLAGLHRLTGTPSYRRVAEAIAERTERRPNEHSHGFLSSVRGMVDLFDASGEKRFLERAESEWRGVVDSGNVFVAGSIPEAWKPKAHRTEGCSEADWLRLGLRLWARTGKSVYLEHAERTLFNEFAMNQFNTGDFGHRVLSRTGSPIGGNEEGGGTARAWWCCTLHGLRAFADVRSHVFRSAAGALAYDLPLEGRGALDGFEVEAESLLEHSALVRLTVTRAGESATPLLIREPSWAYGVEITANGRRLATLNRDGYHRLSQRWKPGDQVLLNYILRSHSQTDPDSGRVSLWHGPWLLGAAETLSPFFFDEPHQANRLDLKPLSGGDLDLEPDPTPDANPFRVPQARFRVAYAPGGYGFVPSSVTLRPVAEQTGLPNSAWEYWFRLKGAAQR